MKDQKSINPFLSGEKNPNSKLSDSDVVEIRKIYKSGSVTMIQLAEKFGVSRRSISAIVNNDRWQHIKS